MEPHGDCYELATADICGGTCLYDLQSVTAATAWKVLSVTARGRNSVRGTAGMLRVKSS